MRVTYIHQHFKLPTESGGTRSWEFARRLVKDGHQVTMICAGEKALRVSVEGVNVRRLSTRYENSMGILSRLISFSLFGAKSTLVACSYPADVVLATSTPLTVAVPGLIASRIRRARFIFEVRDIWPAVPIALGALKGSLPIKMAELLERTAYSGAVSVIALSPWMKEMVESVTPSKNVALIPNASDVSLFRVSDDYRFTLRERYGWSGSRVFVYAGSFGTSYNLEWIVDLAAARRGSGDRFVLYGVGAMSAPLRERCLARGLDPDEVLPGVISKNEVALRISAADAVLSTLVDVPVLQHNSLNKVFDGFAAGRPVIFNHRGWLRDIAVGAGAGWQLDRDPNIAAEQLSKLTSEMLQEASSNSLKLAEAQFDRDMLYQRFEQVLCSPTA